MPVDRAVVLNLSNEHPGVLRVDAGYFQKRAAQCRVLAGQSRDDAAADGLRRLANAFESKARSLEG
jgi:Golgi nucleoside diphosphatase